MDVSLGKKNEYDECDRSLIDQSLMSNEKKKAQLNEKKTSSPRSTMDNAVSSPIAASIQTTHTERLPDGKIRFWSIEA